MTTFVQFTTIQGGAFSLCGTRRIQTYIRSGRARTKIPLAAVRGHRAPGGWDPSTERHVAASRRTGHTSHLGISIRSSPFGGSNHAFRMAPLGTKPVSR
jgi:hypothetical protein